MVTFFLMIKSRYHPNYKAADADAILYGSSLLDSSNTDQVSFKSI